jgi:hypothetical protein
MSGHFIAIEYSDSTYYPIGNFAPWDIEPSDGSVLFHSGTTPDEYALRMRMPFACIVAGIGVKMDVGSNAHDYVLYDELSTALATIVWDGETAIGSSNTALIHLFSSPVTLRRGRVYRIAIKPTTTTFNQATWIWSVLAAAQMGAYPGGTECYLSTRTNAGAWTDFPLQRPFMNLLISHLDGG